MVDADLYLHPIPSMSGHHPAFFQKKGATLFQQLLLALREICSGDFVERNVGSADSDEAARL